MFSSLRARLWFSYALLIVTALGVLTVLLVLYLIQNPLVYRQTLIRLRTVGDGVSAQYPWAALQGSALQSQVEAVAGEFELRVLVYEAGGRLLADSSRSAALDLPRFPRLRLNSVARDPQGQAWIYALYPLRGGRWLMLATERTRVPVLVALRDDFLPPLFLGGLAALALALVLAYGMARWVADPLQRMIQVSQATPVAPSPVPVRGPREVQDLARAFNEMIERVQASQRSQRDLVANVSHELKTPLTSIQGFAQALLDGAADSPQARLQAAGIIHSEAERMYRMVAGLLDLARLDAGTADLQRQQVDPGALVRGVVEKLSPQADRAGVKLEAEAEGLPQIVGDGDRLAQLFTNLIENALKHTPSQGRVLVRGREAPGGLEFTVEDTGEGIPAEAVPRIFERFYQVDGSRAGGERHGAGLGLAIVREIVRAHGGKISLRSVPGRGSTFTVLLPLESQSAQTQARRKK